MARLYAATGDGIARLDEAGGVGGVGSFLPRAPGRWSVSATAGPFAANGGPDPQARLYRRRADEPWQALTNDPLPAMPYALAAAYGRLFAGLADGQIWESRDRGDTWRACTLRGDRIPALRALA